MERNTKVTKEELQALIASIEKEMAQYQSYINRKDQQNNPMYLWWCGVVDALRGVKTALTEV